MYDLCFGNVLLGQLKSCREDITHLCIFLSFEVVEEFFDLQLQMLQPGQRLIFYPFFIIPIIVDATSVVPINLSEVEISLVL